VHAYVVVRMYRRAGRGEGEGAYIPPHPNSSWSCCNHHVPLGGTVQPQAAVVDITGATRNCWTYHVYL
jgi:hypothetical protein